MFIGALSVAVLINVPALKMCLHVGKLKLIERIQGNMVNQELDGSQDIAESEKPCRSTQIATELQ